ncbi:MAG TPA: hypothetical protein VGM80_17405 [Gaiellaceae bacterium]|jgi:hypothetical protein
MRRAALLAVLIATGTLAACGAASGSNPVASAAARSQAQHTELLDVVATMTSAQGDRMTLDGSGSFDSKENRGDIRFHTTSMSVAPSAHPVRSMTETVTQGDNLWVSLQKGSIPGKTWIRFDRAKGVGQTGIDLAAVVGETPADLLGALRTAVSSRTLGSATIGGVATTHYRVMLAPTPATNAILNLMHPTFSPVDVWVDAKGLVRKLMLTYTLIDGANSAHLGVGLSMTFTGYGMPVAVMIPPKAMVVDADEYVG